jgi:hypothetical protein
MPANKPVRIQTIKNEIKGFSFATVISKTSEATIIKMNKNTMQLSYSKDNVKWH